LKRKSTTSLTEKRKEKKRKEKKPIFLNQEKYSKKLIEAEGCSTPVGLAGRLRPHGRKPRRLSSRPTESEQPEAEINILLFTRPKGSSTRRVFFIIIGIVNKNFRLLLLSCDNRTVYYF